jgi:hypothetical protein
MDTKKVKIIQFGLHTQFDGVSTIDGVKKIYK